jgi:uncharacterized protein YneF (UPF0154 family)
MLIEPNLGVIVAVMLLAVVLGIYLGGWIRRKK